VEGSRFIAWQFYRLAAGGSRKLPTICHRLWSWLAFVETLTALGCREHAG
jgi:hypothetical protein